MRPSSPRRKAILHRAVAAAFALSLILIASPRPAAAQTAAGPIFPVPYVLGPDARYEEGCYGPCACAILIQNGLRGSFALSFSAFEPPFIVYDVLDVKWAAPDLGRTFTGTGRYRIGWRGTAQQQITLTISDNGGAPKKYDSGLVPVRVPFPAIDVAASVNGFFCYDYAFFLKAAPARRIGLGVAPDRSDVSWDLFPDAPGYDVVYGRLSVLRATGGDFTVATAGCLGSDVASTPVAGNDDPEIGEVFWYLVRARGGIAGLTYDAGDPGVTGTADAQIDAAADACH